ncbi:hypothetical protein ENU1_199220 [Entamoeba nuttalli P19]|uniref:Uncharacterized protein n=2 Tax=Entamoeba nuttalli TaxID=412467 RepID=K2HND8_ENTNP|nr:hypothetical protein ENU1_199220 [Entamoeba nuttalli P19]EKE37385.1 hypothetical protein ENU1_199220 [Entamoeba nuttalli P19]|eukprot:XP_008860279.1 hypothetical protein ENU1_199220 [Entamoeba nuttalli P19]
MHELFEKDNYSCYHLPTDHSNVVESNVCKDTRYKMKNFEYKPTKPKTYKICDMTKPFKFYVKQYLQDKIDKITNNHEHTKT